MATQPIHGSKGQNVTVNMPEDLARQARVYAAERGISLSKLIAETLRRLLQSPNDYEMARERFEAQLSKKHYGGGSSVKSRDELHER